MIKFKSISKTFMSFVLVGPAEAHTSLTFLQTLLEQYGECRFSIRGSFWKIEQPPCVFGNFGSRGLALLRAPDGADPSVLT